MAAAEVLVAADALRVGILRLVVLVQVLMAIGTDLEVDLLDAVGGQMADRAVVFRFACGGDWAFKQAGAANRISSANWQIAAGKTIAS